MKYFFCLWLLLAHVVAAQVQTPAPETLSAALVALRERAVALAGPSVSADWGARQAQEDLQRLVRACEAMSAALTQNPQVTPTDLHPGRDELLVCRGRLQASLPLFGVDSGGLLEQLTRVTTCLRTLEYRFDGKAQPVGPALAQMALSEPASLPVYDNPRELLGEARNIRYLAEAVTRLRSVWRGQFSPGAGFGTEFYDFVSAAYNFEYACSASYHDVTETRARYRHLVSTYERFRTFGYGLDSFRWSQLENAFTRLAQFYAAAP